MWLIQLAEAKEKHESDLYREKNIFSDVLNCTPHHKRNKEGQKCVCWLNSESVDSCLHEFGFVIRLSPKAGKVIGHFIEAWVWIPGAGWHVTETKHIDGDGTYPVTKQPVGISALSSEAAAHVAVKKWFHSDTSIKLERLSVCLWRYAKACDLEYNQKKAEHLYKCSQSVEFRDVSGSLEWRSWGPLRWKPEAASGA